MKKITLIHHQQNPSSFDDNRFMTIMVDPNEPIQWPGIVPADSRFYLLSRSRETLDIKIEHRNIKQKSSWAGVKITGDIAHAHYVVCIPPDSAPNIQADQSEIPAAVHAALA